MSAQLPLLLKIAEAIFHATPAAAIEHASARSSGFSPQPRQQPRAVFSAAARGACRGMHGLPAVFLSVVVGCARSFRLL